MANEGIFNELNLNPLIVVDDDNDAKHVDTQDTNHLDDDQDEGGSSEKKKSKEKEKEEVVLLVDEDTQDDTPLRTSTSQEDDDETNTSDAGLQQWVTFYREKGLIAEDVTDEEITDIDTLFEKLQENQLTTANALVESYKAQLPKEIRDLVETWEEGAQGEAFKRVLSLKAEEVETNKLDVESVKADVDLQKNVIRSYMKRTTKYDDVKIEKYIKKLEDMEDLQEEAVSTIDELKTLITTEQNEIREATKQAEIRRTREAQTQKEDLQKYIKETKFIIPDVNISDGEKREIESMIFNPVAKDSHGQPVFYLQKLFNENPKEMAVKMNYLAVLTKGFSDWSKLFKKAEVKVSKKVETLLNTPVPNKAKKNSGKEDESWKENLKKIQF